MQKPSKVLNFKKLAWHLMQAIPEIDFVFIFGSAQHGKVKKNSDIDIGAYLNTPVTPELIINIVTAVETITSVQCDLTILNLASEILRFEALKGKLLFVRENKIDDYAEFYSLTCREYEDTMAWMQKQMILREYA